MENKEMAGGWSECGSCSSFPSGCRGKCLRTAPYKFGESPSTAAILTEKQLVEQNGGEI
jgi:hypothetical protein